MIGRKNRLFIVVTILCRDHIGTEISNQDAKPKVFAKETEINHEVVTKKLNELVSARGKKGTDRNIQIDLLVELRDIARANNLGDPIDIKIQLCIIAAIYDYNPNIASSMKGEMWEKCVSHST